MTLDFNPTLYLPEFLLKQHWFSTFLVRSPQTQSCVCPSSLLRVRRRRRRPWRRRWRWRTRSSCLLRACVCPPVASASRCSSWWSWRSTPCVKLLAAPHSGTLNHPETPVSRMNTSTYWSVSLVFSVPCSSSSQWGTFSSCSMTSCLRTISKNASITRHAAFLMNTLCTLIVFCSFFCSI